MMIIVRVFFLITVLFNLQACKMLSGQVVRGPSDQYMDYYPGSKDKAQDNDIKEPQVDNTYIETSSKYEDNTALASLSSQYDSMSPNSYDNTYEEDFPITTDSRIKTYIYNPNGVYLLVVHYGFQSHIEFSKGEEVESIVLGDTFGWKITPLENRLFINPLEKNIRTNMTIITNKKRSYQFDLISKELDQDYQRDLVYIIKFYYPKKRNKVNIR